MAEPMKREITPWERGTNWALYFAAYGLIAAITWRLPIGHYLIVIACVAIVQSSAYWRGKNDSEETK